MCACSNLVSWMLAGMVDYHLNLGRHFAYPHMLIDGAQAAPPPAPAAQLLGVCTSCRRVCGHTQLAEYDVWAARSRRPTASPVGRA